MDQQESRIFYFTKGELNLMAQALLVADIKGRDAFVFATLLTKLSHHIEEFDTPAPSLSGKGPEKTEKQKK